LAKKSKNRFWSKATNTESVVKLPLTSANEALSQS